MAGSGDVLELDPPQPPDADIDPNAESPPWNPDPGPEGFEGSATDPFPAAPTVTV